MTQLLWPIILILTVIIEIMTVSLVSIWFSIGALFAYFTYLLHFSLFIQVLVFLSLSILTIYIIRPIAYKMLKGNIIKTNSDRIIGQIGIVTKDIRFEKRGEVKVENTYWQAESLTHDDILKDHYVEIVSIVGAHVIVKEIKGGNSHDF